MFRFYVNFKISFYKLNILMTNAQQIFSIPQKMYQLSLKFLTKDPKRKSSRKFTKRKCTMNIVNAWDDFRTKQINSTILTVLLLFGSSYRKRKRIPFFSQLTFLSQMEWWCRSRSSFFVYKLNSLSECVVVFQHFFLLVSPSLSFSFSQTINTVDIFIFFWILSCGVRYSFYNLFVFVYKL